MIVLQIRAQTVFSVPMVLTTFFVIVQQVQNGLAKIAAPIPSVPRLTHAILMEPVRTLHVRAKPLLRLRVFRRTFGTDQPAPIKISVQL